ncbi:hypothetical protein SLS56_005050 [Neofusicoccum ribis]|uniref:Uncharacterized protein n=1 Tax=Neofusicoccum ribis TaxID=45134 RepID=A0ABR3SUG8_9PEZI
MELTTAKGAKKKFPEIFQDINEYERRGFEVWDENEASENVEGEGDEQNDLQIQNSVQEQGDDQIPDDRQGQADPAESAAGKNLPPNLQASSREVSERMKRWKDEDEHHKEELTEMEERHQQKVYQLIDEQDVAQIDICEAEEAFSKAVRGAWHDDDKELKAVDVERRKVRDELHKLIWEMEEEYHVHGRAAKDVKEKYRRQIRERKPAGEQQTQARPEEELLKPEDFAEDEDMEDDAPQEFLDKHQSGLRGREHSDCPVTATSTNGVCPVDLIPQPNHGLDLPVRPHLNQLPFINRFVGTYSAPGPASTQGPSSPSAITANAESYSSIPPESPPSPDPSPAPPYPLVHALSPGISSSATSPTILALRSSVPDEDDDNLFIHPALPLRLRLRPVDTTPLQPPAAPPSSPTIPTDDLAQRRDPDGLSQLDCVMRGASSMGAPGRPLARPERVGAWDEEEEEVVVVVRGDAGTDNNPAIVSPRRHDDDDALSFVPCRGRTATPFRCSAATPDSAASSSSSSHTVSPDPRSSPLATFGGLDGAMDDEMIEECEGCSDVQGGRAEKRGAEGAGCSKEKGPAGTPQRAESYPRKQQPVSGEGPASDRYVSKHITMSGTIIVLKTGRKPVEKSHGDRSGKQV